MAVTINGTTGISNPNGSANIPSTRGEDSDTGMFFPAANTIALATNSVERLRVDSAGNVGIGTTSPQAYSGYTVATVDNATNGGVVSVRRAGTALINLYTAAGEGRVEAANNATLGLWTASVERMKIDQSGRVTMPAQPVFLATKNDNSNQIGVGVYIFDDVWINVGSCYNSSNGRFTAPVTGTYWFTTTFQMWGIVVGSTCAFAFYKNGVQYPHGAGADGAHGMQSVNDKAGAQTYHTSPSLSGAIQMTAGDYVTSTITSGTARGMQSHFSGYLIG